MRRPATPIPELPASPRRKRSLSEEERALWESVAKQTKPLRRKARAAKAEVAEAPAVAENLRLQPGHFQQPGIRVRRNRSRRQPRRWRRSDAASVRNCRAGGRKSMRGSTSTA